MIMGLLLWIVAALAAPGVEIVLVLDNRVEVERGPVGRAQEEGAAALFAPVEAAEGRLTVIGLAEDARSQPTILDDPGAVAQLEPVRGGHLAPSLYAAQAVFATSPRERHLLVIVAHGELAGGLSGAELRAALPSAPQTGISWVALGEGSAAEALAASDWDLQRADLNWEAIGRALFRAGRLAYALPEPELRLAVTIPEEAPAGVPLALWAWLERDGVRVEAPQAVLGAGLEARAELGGSNVPFSLLEDGRWGGRWTPPGPEGQVHGSVRLRGEDFELRADLTTWVEGALAPVLLPSPIAVDLGTWESESSMTQRCAEIDVSGSARASQLDLLCLPTAPSGAITLVCSPAPGQEPGAAVLRWQVCGYAPACCGDAPGADEEPLSVRFVQRDARGGELMATVPVTYRVIGQNLLLCRGPGVLLTVALAGLALGALGMRRAPRFSPELGVRLASSEPGLRRAKLLGLARLASARRPFWPGSVAFDVGGAPVPSVEGAALVLEPSADGAARVARGASLERRLQGSAGWTLVDEGERTSGLQQGTVYRVSERLYFILS